MPDFPSWMFQPTASAGLNHRGPGPIPQKSEMSRGPVGALYRVEQLEADYAKALADPNTAEAERLHRELSSPDYDPEQERLAELSRRVDAHPGRKPDLAQERKLLSDLAECEAQLASTEARKKAILSRGKLHGGIRLQVMTSKTFETLHRLDAKIDQLKFRRASIERPLAEFERWRESERREEERKAVMERQKQEREQFFKLSHRLAAIEREKFEIQSQLKASKNHVNSTLR
jgi:hypothetical protein